MKKINPRELKRFEIKTQEDALMILGSLIAPVKMDLEKYAEYRDELEQLVIKYAALNEDKETLIPANEYENINDKLLFRQREMLKYCSDHQKDSFSYMSVRGAFVKRGFLKRDLETQVSKILNEFLDIRNLSFHNTQSGYTASKEVALKGMPDFLRDLVTINPQINPIIISKIINYDFAFIASSLIHADEIKKRFSLVIQAMMSDYEEMFMNLKNRPIFLSGDGGIQFYENSITKRLLDHSTDSTQISMAIQKAKYSGSQEDFDKYAIFSTKEKNKDTDAR